MRHLANLGEYVRVPSSPSLAFAKQRDPTSYRWTYIFKIILGLLGVLALGASLLQISQTSNQPHLPEAVVTLLTSEEYLLGALVLASTLRQHSPNRERIALLTPNATDDPLHRRMLVDAGWQLRDVELLRFAQHENFPTPERYLGVMTKLLVWNMTEFETLAFIDSDAMLLRDIDGAFDLMSGSGYPLAGCMDIRTDIVNAELDDVFQGHINAGAMFVKPNRTIFEELVQQAGTADYYSNLPEQSLISRYFQGRWLGLDSDYNLPFLFVYSQRKWFYQQRRPTTRLLHFAGDYKAWNGCAQDDDNNEICAHIHPDVQLWREALKQVMREINVSAEDIMKERGPKMLGYDVKELITSVEH